ncbi:hypothetical protein D0N36_16870 [Hymenobacter lapidiphilus]|uniref:hypothetical protein n=1 Tax=Hymenobacter sp. CCM 8763 TaxID=2303334 RepID=UPI000E34BB13|nr:hypothetical protein [Hymenobacter sp. CCM 8763]RFP63950.1 hypothetical protein D0N36_16870 [Hymenobacter sp. CCM 8763]
MNTVVIFRLLLPAALLLGGCTTSQETANEEASVRRVPSRILTDADRQAAYNSNAGYGGATPDATPGRVRPGEQASGINSQKNPESLNTDNNNTATPETRLRRVKGTPADTLRLP